MTRMDVTRTILIVDNDPLYREMLCERFRQNTTWTILYASDASDCLHLIRLAAGKIDIALIDTVMPRGINNEIPNRRDEYYGIEVARIIKAEFGDVRIFGMSVDINEEGELFWKLRTDGFIGKAELRPAMFGSTVDRLCNLSNDPEVRVFRDGFENGADPPEVVAESRRSKKSISYGSDPTVNVRIIETMIGKPESEGWTCQQWADYLGCAKSTVCETTVWKKVISPRHKAAQAENACAKRQNGRPVRD